MANHIYTPSSEELESRIARFEDLQEMSTAKKYEWCGQEALDVIFARKLMPVILDDTKNPFGNVAPINGAAGTTMFISIMPPGQGPCLHSHNSTYETFLVLERYRATDYLKLLIQLIEKSKPSLIALNAAERYRNSLLAPSSG